MENTTQTSALRAQFSMMFSLIALLTSALVERVPTCSLWSHTVPPLVSPVVTHSLFPLRGQHIGPSPSHTVRAFSRFMLCASHFQGKEQILGKCKSV